MTHGLVREYRDGCRCEKCISAQRLYVRRRREHGNLAQKQRKRHLAVRAEIAKAKDVPCADCGGRFPAVCMDFDHLPERGPKKFNVSQTSRSAESRAEEMAKCEVVCANCHRIRSQFRLDSEPNRGITVPEPGD